MGTRMKPKEILCDMDSVLVDLNGSWLPALERDYGVKVSVEDLLEWEMLNAKPLKHLTPKQVYGYLEKPGFFRNLKPLPGAIAGLRKLISAGHRVVILSSAGNPVAAKEKREWLLEWCPFLQKGSVIIIGDMSQKMMVDADFIIDDNPDVLRFWAQQSPYRRVTLGIEYPYNRNLVPWGSTLRNNHQYIYRMGDHRDIRAAWAKIVKFINGD